MIRKVFNLALIVTLAITAALAQQPTSTTASPDRLRQVITYLASEALEGRRTGTPGADDAANYIRREFMRQGLRPGVQLSRTRDIPAGYFQPFPYVSKVELGKNNFFGESWPGR